MKLSCMVTTYDRQDDLVECIESLHRQFDSADEFVVVDDGDSDDTERLFQAEGLVDVEHGVGAHAGLPSARDQGTEAATGVVVAFIDDDVVLPSNWTQELKGTYERFPPQRVSVATSETTIQRKLTR